MNKKHFNLFYCIAAVLITALLAAGCLPAFSTAPTPSPTSTKPPLPITGNDTTTPSVVVRDQQFKGDTIVVDRVVSKGKGWIAIHIEKDGKLGDAIAYAPVNDGVNTNVTVKLDVTQASPVMYAMLHTDAGEIGKYEFPGADVPVLLDGQMINPPFHVTPGIAGSSDKKPYLIVRDQQVVDGKVTIDEVYSPAQGWVDIHMQENNERARISDLPR